MEAHEKSWGDPPGTRLKVLYYDDLPGRMFLPAGSYVFSDLEGLGEAGTELAAQAWQLLARNGRSRCLNDPTRVLRREDLLTRLGGRGQNHFRVFSPGADLSALSYPAFLETDRGREEGLRELVRNPTELRRAMWKALLLGYAKRELLVIETFDSRDDAGLFRRYTAYVIGDRVLPGGLFHSRDWKLEDTEPPDAQLDAERKTFLETNPHEAALRSICRDACVEFGRVDYFFHKDQIQIWELQSNPGVSRLSDSLDDALATIDTPARTGADTPLRFPPELVGRYSAELRALGRRSQVRSGLRGAYSLAAPLWRLGAPG
jgi:hypothetical protein